MLKLKEKTMLKTQPNQDCIFTTSRWDTGILWALKQPCRGYGCWWNCHWCQHGLAVAPCDVLMCLDHRGPRAWIRWLKKPMMPLAWWRIPQYLKEAWSCTWHVYGSPSGLMDSWHKHLRLILDETMGYHQLALASFICHSSINWLTSS